MPFDSIINHQVLYSIQAKKGRLYGSNIFLQRKNDEATLTSHAMRLWRAPRRSELSLKKETTRKVLQLDSSTISVKIIFFVLKEVCLRRLLCLFSEGKINYYAD